MADNEINKVSINNVSKYLNVSFPNNNSKTTPRIVHKTVLGDAVQQSQDAAEGETTFSFTGKNANATTLDEKLTGDIQYGAVGAFSASFGGKSSAQGKRSMAVGTTTIAKGAYSFASGDNSVALGNDSHAEGYSTVTGPNGAAAHSEGYNTQALGHSSHSEGNNTIAKGNQSHVEGVRTTANGEISHAEGVDTKANADNSHTEGNSTATKTALPTSGGSGSSDGSSGGSTDNPDDTSWNIDEHRGVSSHAEGVGSTTYGYASHAEGFNSVAYGHLSHAEGDKAVTGTFAGSDGWAAHAEGQSTTASGDFSHAEGQSTTASGIYSHTGGINTSASGMGSFAHGNNATASGNYSVAFGRDTSANHDQFALGIKNVASEKALLMVGNNKSTNAFEVLNDGSASVQKKLIVGENLSVTSGTLTTPGLSVSGFGSFSYSGIEGSTSNSSSWNCNLPLWTCTRSGTPTASSVGSYQPNTPCYHPNSDLYYNPYTETLTVKNLVGNASSATNAANVSVTTSNSKLYLLGVTNGTSGNSPCYANLSVYATNGAMNATSYNASSDSRLKENIVDYHCEKSILDLPVKKFDFINGPKNQIGCIAQDLQEICPEIVSENSDGYLSIQESKIAYLLLEEVKRLRREVDELKGDK